MAQLLPSTIDDNDYHAVIYRKRAMRQKRTAVRGVIVPTSWDEKGNVTGIAISAQDEIEYLVEMIERGKDLMGFVNREVEVNGEVADIADKKSIAIEDYRLLGT